MPPGARARADPASPESACRALSTRQRLEGAAHAKSAGSRRDPAWASVASHAQGPRASNRTTLSLKAIDQSRLRRLSCVRAQPTASPSDRATFPQDVPTLGNDRSPSARVLPFRGFRARRGRDLRASRAGARAAPLQKARLFSTLIWRSPSTPPLSSILDTPPIWALRRTNGRLSGPRCRQLPNTSLAPFRPARSATREATIRVTTA